MSKRVVLENVDRYRVIEPVFEAARVALAYMGETYSPAYIQGISGQAFRIAGPCPCAPTCDYAMLPDQLVKLLGYEMESVAYVSGDVTKTEAIIKRTKEELRAGRPVIMWHAFTSYEYDVIAGYDDEKNVFLGRGSYGHMQEDYVSEPQDRASKHDVSLPSSAIFIGKKTGTFDARTAEIAALKEAVLHAHGAASEEKWLLGGIPCYDQWIASYQKKGCVNTGKDLPTDFYSLIILPSTRQAASEFMRDLAPKYPEASVHFEMAAEHFAKESAALSKCSENLGDRSQKPTDEQCIRAAAYLGEARVMYGLAIGEIEQALRAIKE